MLQFILQVFSKYISEKYSMSPVTFEQGPKLCHSVLVAKICHVPGRNKSGVSNYSIKLALREITAGCTCIVLLLIGVGVPFKS